jgi:hypothetical protein
MEKKSQRKTKRRTAAYNGKPLTLRYRKQFLEQMMCGETNLPDPFNHPVGNIPDYFIEILQSTFDYMKLKKNQAKVYYDEDDDNVYFKIVPNLEKTP